MATCEALDSHEHGYPPAGTAVSTVEFDHVDSTWSRERDLSDAIETSVVPEIYRSYVSQPATPETKIDAKLKEDQQHSNMTIPQATTTPSSTLQNSKMDYLEPEEKLPGQDLDPDAKLASLDGLLQPRVLIPDAAIEAMPSFPEVSHVSSPRSREMESVSSNSYPTKLLLPPPPPPPGPGPGPGPHSNVSFPASSPIPPQQAIFSPVQNDPPHNKEWDKLKNLREEVWGLRSRTQEIRRVLQEKQDALTVADNAYLSHVRRIELGVNNTSRKSNQRDQELREELFQACSKARDEYGPLQDDLIIMENSLGTQEFTLQQLEEDLYSRPPPPVQATIPPQSSRSRASSVSTDSAIGREHHPLVSAYLSFIGDISILAERLDWILEEKFALESEADTRARVGLTLAEPDQEWLNNFPATEEALLKELDEAERNKEKARKRCFEFGLVDENGDLTRFEEQERRVFADEGLIEDTGSEQSGFVKFPILIPQPGTKGPSDDPNSDEGGPRINAWLLTQLRSSPLAVNLLARTFEHLFGAIKSEKWQIDVLHFWYRDSEGSESSISEAPSSGVITQAPRKIGGVTRSESEGDDEGEARIQIQAASLPPDLSEPQWIETREGYQLLLPLKEKPNVSKSV